MDRIVVERQVSVEGVLNLILPLGKDQAGQNVRVTVEPVDLKKRGHSSSGVLASWQRQVVGRANSNDPHQENLKRESRCRESSARHECIHRSHAVRPAIAGYGQATHHSAR